MTLDQSTQPSPFRPADQPFKEWDLVATGDLLAKITEYLPLEIALNTLVQAHRGSSGVDGLKLTLAGDGHLLAQPFASATKAGQVVYTAITAPSTVEKIQQIISDGWPAGLSPEKLNDREKGLWVVTEETDSAAGVWMIDLRAADPRKAALALANRIQEMVTVALARPERAWYDSWGVLRHHH